MLCAALFLWPLAIIAKYIRDIGPLISLAFFVAFVAVLHVSGNIAFYDHLIYGAFAALAFAYFNMPRFKSLALLGIVAGLVLAKFHLLPGYTNYQYLAGYQKSFDSIPFNVWFNFDTATLVYPIWWFFSDQKKQGSILTFTAMIVLTITTLMSLALYFDFIRFDFQLSPHLPLWALNNLFYVCVFEELLFRGLIMEYLRPYNAMLALLISSALFAAIHVPGGLVYALLSGVAGLCYGLTYLKMNAIIYPILLHFFLNTTHFVFFSYPGKIQNPVIIQPAKVIEAA